MSTLQCLAECEKGDAARLLPVKRLQDSLSISRNQSWAAIMDEEFDEGADVDYDSEGTVSDLDEIERRACGEGE